MQKGGWIIGENDEGTNNLIIDRNMNLDKISSANISVYTPTE